MSWPSQTHLHLWAHSYPRGAKGFPVQCLKPNSPRVQDYSPRSHGSQAQGRFISAGGPSLSIPQSKEAAIPTGMALLWINMGDTKSIYHCWVRGAQRDLWLPMLLYAPMCVGPILAWSSYVHPTPATSLTLMPSDDMIAGASISVFRPSLKSVHVHMLWQKLVSLNSNIRVYTRSHLVSNSWWSQVILLLPFFSTRSYWYYLFSINLGGIVSTSTVHQDFYLIADVTAFTVLFYLIHCV